MGLIRRVFSVALGVAAGAFAYKLLDDYNKKEHLEGEYTEILLPPDDADPQPDAQTQDAAPQPTDATPPSENPVTLGEAAKPILPDGTLDATRIASPEDFADWSDSGCRG